jgi:hypothetical protein
MGMVGSWSRKSNPGSVNPKLGSSGSAGSESPNDGNGIGGSCRLSENPGIVNPKLGSCGSSGSASPSDGHGIGGSRNEHLDANEHSGGWQG